MKSKNKLMKNFLKESSISSFYLPFLIFKGFVYLNKFNKKGSPYLKIDGYDKLYDINRPIPNEIVDSGSIFMDSLKFLDGSLLWHRPETLQNVTPPVAITSVASSLFS